ncbi:hypothetical protein [Edaphobacter modestus]|uniref:Uncharacterized protein n=1 Tax=Edaphobacter modestus TaxID=388466 RepID=A0A4Q7YG93_9BACT|nr:hypothetical protein [Edaphobacter modestus]RZU35329.1 hypothetical protein BDD14_6104 [Edaphobacter modestus]
MQASIKTEADGMVNWRLDPEAAQAVFASVIFASRFHEGIAPLAVMAAERLHGDGELRVYGRRKELCQ